MSKKELLPCPFCGSPAEYEAPAERNWYCASVTCSNPRCIVNPHACVEKSPKKAIAAWNTRAKQQCPSEGDELVWVKWDPNVRIKMRLCDGWEDEEWAYQLNLSGEHHPTTVVALQLPRAALLVLQEKN